MEKSFRLTPCKSDVCAKELPCKSVHSCKSDAWQKCPLVQKRPSVQKWCRAKVAPRAKVTLCKSVPPCKSDTHPFVRFEQKYDTSMLSRIIWYLSVFISSGISGDIQISPSLLWPNVFFLKYDSRKVSLMQVSTTLAKNHSYLPLLSIQNAWT